ncbi:MAG TPA: ROK family protein [Chitinophagaceae bacterium]|nr:ROK family protein [Chitinophagaceae bacterium]
MSLTAIGVDLGGTRIKILAIDAGGNTLHQAYISTNDSGDTMWTENVIAGVDAVKKILPGGEIIVGLSAPGVCNEDNTAVAFMPGRLQGLENLVWQQHFNCSAWVVNDAVAALLAEAKAGAAVGKKNVVLLTLGTGVGGAILIDGKPYAGAFQKAGHLGHLTLNSYGEADITGIPGSLEDAIGNCTIEKRSLGKYRFTHDLLTDYRKGDYFAQWLWLSSVRNLAIGIASITNILSPEIILLGGGITEAEGDLFKPLEDFIPLYEWRLKENKVAIKKAQFGDFAGAIGAAFFALDKYTMNKEQA